MRMDTILSNKKNTLAKKINNELMPKMGSMTEKEVRETFLGYLDDFSISMSKETRNKYIIQIANKKDYNSLVSFIYNIGLKTDGMGTF